MDAAQQIKDLQTMISEQNVRIMYFELKEEEWDRECLELTSKVNRLKKEMNILKSERNSISERQEREHDFE